MPVHGCTGKVEMSMDANGDRSRDISGCFRHFFSIIGAKNQQAKQTLCPEYNTVGTLSRKKVDSVFCLC